MKNENPGILYIVISIAWCPLDIFKKCTEKWKFPNFQIYSFYDFFVLKSMKFTKKKPLKILFFVFYDTSYIENTGNGNNYLNLPINWNMRYFFGEYM